MKVGFTAPVTYLSGRPGEESIVYAKTKAGNVARQFAQPANPRTTSQQQVRGILTTLSKEWANISDANRDAWNTWAETQQWRDRFGTLIDVSGFAAYMRANMPLNGYLDGTPSNTPPTVAAPAPITLAANASYTNATNSLSFTLTHGITSIANKYVVCKLVRTAAAAGRQAQPNDYTSVAGFAPASCVPLKASGQVHTWTDTTNFSPTNGNDYDVELFVLGANGLESTPYRIRLTFSVI